VTRLRRLSGRGIETFREYLQKIREGEEFQASPAILHVDDFSSPVDPSIDIRMTEFKSKFEAASYLARALEPLHGPALHADAGLWSWLALFYFEQLSPKDGEGRRRPREDYHYIPWMGDGWQSDRHLLAGPFKIFMTHGDRARLLLYPPVHQHGQFVYDLGFRRELITNRGLIEAIDILYWDAKRGRPKRGATTASRGGNLRRLIAVLQQLDFNYDLYGMTAAEILELLPNEFDGWKPTTAREAEKERGAGVSSTDARRG
jgi:hypothetical protein